MSQLNEWNTDVFSQYVTQSVAQVVVLGDAGEVHLDGQDLPARRAASCLLTPQPGDTVLLAQTARGTASWVLAVLERATPDTVAALSVAGACDTQLTSAGSLTLLAGDRLAHAAQHYTLLAESAQIDVETVTLRSRFTRWVADAIETTARTIDSVTERYTLRARSSLRVTSEADTLRAGQVDVHAEAGLLLSGEQAIVQARGVVKVNGKQVHVG